jgi:hypothetical protein
MIFIIEYDRRGKRAQKEFEDQYKAGAFYRSKFKDGKNPKLIAKKPEEIVVSDIYHTALSEKKRDVAAEPLTRWEDCRGLAFVHDISSGVIPVEYNQADVFYSEPAWRHGYKKFMENLAVKPIGGYEDYLSTQLHFIQESKVHAFLVIGKSLLKRCDPEHARPITLRGGNAVLAVWNTTFTKNIEQCDRLIDYLASTYNCLVDPSCGYGNAARRFHRNGKRFVATDINPICIGVIAERLRDATSSVPS